MFQTTRPLDIESQSARGDVRGKLGIGSLVGRYRLEGLLGAGGMGVVFRAHDEKLQRKVALKVLHYPLAHGRRESGALLREAQALAKLEHPNVVPIFDAGTHEGALFLVMALVEGQTLLKWGETSNPRWRAVVETMQGAAAGLAAAHAQGLIHRDFKPDNVMLSDDGVPLVMDFGLASVRVSETDRGLTSPSNAGNLEMGRVSRAGRHPGTPAYMAPELWAGEPADQRSDLYAYCVSYWEILFSAHPFDLSSVDTLRYGVTHERFVEPATEVSRRVPRWLRSLLERGLSAEPDNRWQSVEQLSREIRRRLRRRRRRTFSLVAVSVAAGVTAVGVLHFQAVDARELASCLARENSIASAPRPKASIAGANAGAYERFERWKLLWGDTNRQACESRSTATLDWTKACLDLHASAAQNVAALWRQAQESELPFHAPSWMGRGMADPRSCGKVSQAPGHYALSRAQFEQAVAAQRRLLDATGALSAEDRSLALERLDEALPVVRELGFRPLVLRQYRLRCIALQTSSDHVALHDACSNAYEAALELGELELAADAAGLLASRLAPQGRRKKEARRWVDRAKACLAQVGTTPQGWNEMARVGAELNVLAAEGALDMETLETRLSMAAKPAFGLLRADTRGQFLGALGSDLHVRGSLGQAEHAIRRALEVSDPTGRTSFVLHLNLALVIQQRGKPTTGIEAFEAVAWQLDEGRLDIAGDDAFRDLVTSTTAVLRSNVDAAERHEQDLRHAVERLTALLGGENSWVSSKKLQLAQIQRRLGMFERHRATISSAISDSEGATPPEGELDVSLHSEWLLHVAGEDLERSWAELQPGMEKVSNDFQISIMTAAARAFAKAQRFEQAETIARSACKLETENVLTSAEATLVFADICAAQRTRAELHREARRRVHLALARFEKRPADLAQRLSQWLAQHPQPVSAR
ncbi:MAG: serine/threonine protein kinase [Nannocystaceae bacterium]|nr:serine/threonine protein kinase [Nannocystaceae bacterium]